MVRTDGRTDTEGYNIIPRHTLVAGIKTLEKLFLRSTHCLSQYYYHVCHLEIPKQMFLKSLHIFPPILAAMFFPSSIWLWHVSSLNVLKMF